MKAYVETNFLLELALLQEQHQSCDETVGLCESGSIGLALPAFCVPEAHFTLVGKIKRREPFTREFEDQRAELNRSFRFKDQTDLLNAVHGFLTASVEREYREFNRSLSRVMAVAELISLSVGTLQSVMSLVTTTNLQFPDAIVVASVLAHLDAFPSSESCFLNRDKRDFRNPYIVQELAKRGCKMMFSFRDGANFLRGSQRP